MIAVIRIRILAGVDYNPYFDRWVNGLHRIDVVARKRRITVGIVWARVRVGFPRSVVLVSYFPELEAIAFGYV